jgi:hypothetical protein
MNTWRIGLITGTAALMVGVLPGHAQITSCCVSQIPDYAPIPVASVPQEAFVAAEHNDCQPKHNQDGLYFTRTTTSSVCWASAAVYLPVDIVPTLLSCEVTDTSTSTYIMARLKKRVSGSAYPVTILGLGTATDPAAQSSDRTGIQAIWYSGPTSRDPVAAGEAWFVTVAYYRNVAGVSDADKNAKLHYCTIYVSEP